MKYMVIRIMGPDYGCEESLDDYVAMDKVILGDENGAERMMEVLGWTKEITEYSMKN